MTPSRRRTLLQQAQLIAEERATTWAVYQTDSKGNRLTGWRLVQAPTRERAMKQVRRATGASPTLSTREWQAVYTEVGL